MDISAISFPVRLGFGTGMAQGATSKSSVTGPVEEADAFKTLEDAAVAAILDTTCSADCALESGVLLGIVLVPWSVHFIWP